MLDKLAEEAQPPTTPPPLTAVDTEGIPPDVIEKLQEAVETGSYMVAVFSANGTEVRMWRMTKDFITSEFSSVLDLLEQDLESERESLNA